MSEPLEAKLRESALTVLRRYGVSEEELQADASKPGAPPYYEWRGHRIKVHVDASSATFLVKGGRWTARREDFPSAGSFLAEFETQLARAISGEWR